MATTRKDWLVQQGLHLFMSTSGVKSVEEVQCVQLTNLLRQAQHTAFGRAHGFDALLRQKLTGKELFEAYKSKVPIFTYDEMTELWWNRALAGESDVCWPGQIPFVAISSGTSGTYRKKIPMTSQLIQSNRKGALRQIMAFPSFGLSYSTLMGETLMLGETTALVDKGTHLEGYMSSIMLNQMPFLARMRMKPEASIRQMSEWNERINRIIVKAPDWDIHCLSGLPSWTNLLFEQIIRYHGLNNLHDIWPNLSVFAHGGLSFDPYRSLFRQYLGRDITCLDSYIASEGYIACQTEPMQSGLTMQSDIGIFFEFIPFNASNFDENGHLLPTYDSFCLGEVSEGIDYALLLSTPAGAWRYMLGDTVQFTDVVRNQIRVTGRTQHFINLCGEHLIMANMLEAMQLVTEQLHFSAPEFTILPQHRGNTFFHEWFIGVEAQAPPDSEPVVQILDRYLRQINIYYRELRDDSILSLPLIHLLPKEYFYRYLESKGKIGGQHKFPKVLTELHRRQWIDYLHTCGLY
jgi:hypothetical protein